MDDVHIHIYTTFYYDYYYYYSVLLDKHEL